MVICLEQDAGCLHMVQLMPPHLKTQPSLALFQSRLVLPFWYWLTQVVLEKRPLNWCNNVVVVAGRAGQQQQAVTLSHISSDDNSRLLP